MPSALADEILLENTRPAAWINPVAQGRYNLVVVGAGTAGLVASAIAAGLGARVALVERDRLGGDCLHHGCVPSKALLRAARAWAAVRGSTAFGVHVPLEQTRFEFPEVMARMRRLRARLSPADSAQRFRSLGVDVFLGAGRFTGPDTLTVGQQTLRFRKAVVCTGGRAAAPEIPGIAEAGYLTNETIFDLNNLPPRLAVLGGGPVGCELAQAFARFGSRVTILQRSSRLLRREEPEAAAVVTSSLEADGVSILLDATVARVERRDGGKVLHYERRGMSVEVPVDEILVGIGRSPNVQNLGLDVVGVDHGPRLGIEVNSRLQTTNPAIYAAGDVCAAMKFTHLAEAHAQIVVRNALFPHPLSLGYATTDRLVVPRCTYTDPELAAVGLSAAEAAERGLDVDTFTVPLAEVDRAVLDGQDEGFARVLVKRGTDRILGATLVSAHAGELITEMTLLMTNRLGLGKAGSTIHPYPTQAEAIKKLAYAWRRASLTAGRKALLTRLFELMR